MSLPGTREALVSLGQHAIEAEVQSKVYALLVPIFERLEGYKLITGNGHHMAQKMAAQAAELLKERWIDKGDKPSEAEA